MPASCDQEWKWSGKAKPLGHEACDRCVHPPVRPPWSRPQSRSPDFTKVGYVLAYAALVQDIIAYDKRPLSHLTEGWKVFEDQAPERQIEEPLNLALPSLPSLPSLSSADLRLKTKVLISALQMTLSSLPQHDCDNLEFDDSTNACISCACHQWQMMIPWRHCLLAMHHANRPAGMPRY
jgi:hypothetical protein